MRVLAAGILGISLVLWGPIVKSGSTGSVDAPGLPAPAVATSAAPAPAHAALAPEDLTAVVQRYCQVCHNSQLLTGNLSLEGFDVANPVPRAETAEKMIQKLRVGMMPPPGVPRPGGDTLMALVETVEQTLDRADAAPSNPGRRSFQA